MMLTASNSSLNQFCSDSTCVTMTSALEVKNVMCCINLFYLFASELIMGPAVTASVCMRCGVDNLYQYGCDWNYRPDHCMYMSNCKPAELYGVSVLHGCRRAFHIDKWPIFRAVYQTIEKVCMTSH